MFQIFSLVIGQLKKINYQHWSWVILSLLLGAGFWLRFQNIAEFSRLSFFDGGRDMLVAKHLADGLTSWKIAPDSTGIFPNTPLYFLILGLSYKFLGGGIGVIGLHLVLGIGLIWLAFLIGRLLADELTGLFLAVLVTFSPGLIVASQTVWQPHFQYFFVGLAIYVWLKAVNGAESRWYFLSQVATILMLSLYNGVLPVAGLLSFGLIFSWFKTAKHNQNFRSLTKSFLVFSVVVWLIWFGAIYGILLTFPNFSLSYIANPFIHAGTNLNWLVKIYRIFCLSLQLITSNPGFAVIELFYLLGFSLIYTNMFRQNLATFKQKKLNWQVLFFSLVYFSFGIALLLPGGESFNWRITAQSLVLLILMGLIPAVVFQKHWSRWLAYLVILGVFFNSNFNFYRSHLLQKNDGDFLVSQKLAEMINLDVISHDIAKTDFNILVRINENSVPETYNLAAFWDSASIQLALELQDADYTKRVQLVPWPIIFSNYLQPASHNYYLVCLADQLSQDCLSEMTDTKSFSIRSVADLESSSVGQIKLYQLTKILP